MKPIYNINDKFERTDDFGYIISCEILYISDQMNNENEWCYFCKIVDEETEEYFKKIFYVSMSESELKRIYNLT